MSRGSLVFLRASVLCVVGCSESHQLGRDAGTFMGDAPERVDGGGCGTMPPATCVSESGHVCGDAFSWPVCVAGAWVCPSGTRSDAVCWCQGGVVRDPACTCTPTGWVCPPSECPADPDAAIGTWCATEGQSCGACTDPCGFCNVLQCSGGVWTRLEADPPPGTCESFACGPELRCVRYAQYCDHVLDDTGGPDAYSCGEYFDDCRRDCSCFAWRSTDCSDDGAGAVEVRSGGG